MPLGMFSHVNLIFELGQVATIPIKAPLKAVLLPATIQVMIKFPRGAADTRVQGP